MCSSHSSGAANALDVDELVIRAAGEGARRRQLFRHRFRRPTVDGRAPHYVRNCETKPSQAGATQRWPRTQRRSIDALDER